MTSCLRKLVRVFLAAISLTAFSKRIFKRICSHSSYLLRLTKINSLLFWPTLYTVHTVVQKTGLLAIFSSIHVARGCQQPTISQGSYSDTFKVLLDIRAEMTACAPISYFSLAASLLSTPSLSFAPSPFRFCASPLSWSGPLKSCKNVWINDESYFGGVPNTFLYTSA